MTVPRPANPFSIEGCNTVIVGGTAGIGYAVAQHFRAHGAEVVITGRRAADELAEAIGATAVAMDVADSASVEAGFAAIAEVMPRIDCLILNAGIEPATGLIDDYDMDAFEQVINVNTVGLARAMHHGIKLVPDGGSVVVTSSPAGSVTTPGLSGYAASKAALDMLVKSWALDLGPRQVRVNAILPGIVQSEMGFGATPDGELVRRMTANGQYRNSEDMGPVFHFLASPASVTLTGSLVGAHDGIPIGFSGEVLDHLAADLTEPG